MHTSPHTKISQFNGSFVGSEMFGAMIIQVFSLDCIALWYCLSLRAVANQKANSGDINSLSLTLYL